MKSSLWSVCHVLSCPSAAVRVTGGERAAGECVAAAAALAERSPHLGLVNLYHYLWETVFMRAFLFK